MELSAIMHLWFKGKLPMKTLVYSFLALLFIFVAGTVKTYAEEVERPMILQFMIGEMVISNDDPRVSDGDYNITLFGVAAQKPFYGEKLQVGIETGGLFNWKSETRAYAASGGGGGGTVAISANINQFLFDYFFGGYVSLQPLKWFRLYAGAGPLLIYGSRETEENDPATSQVEPKSDSGFSAGVYGRAGIDIIIAEKFIIGVSVRGTQTGLSFDDTVGHVDVEGWQYFGVISFRF
jgi:opacity protein-like surface antigen